MFGSYSRNQDKFTVSFISLDHLDYSHGVLAVFYNHFFISGSKFLSPSMKAVVRTCACAISLDHLDFRLLCLAHIATQNQDEYTRFYFETEVHLPILQGSCSNLELMRILLIIIFFLF